MDQVEDRRRAGNLLTRKGVARGCGLQVVLLHRHGVDLSIAQGGMLHQALADVGEVSIWVSRGGHTLVYLDHVDTLPRDIITGQGMEHEPRGVAAADGHDEAPRAAAAARASAAIIVPALRATASALARTSVFIRMSPTSIPRSRSGSASAQRVRPSAECQQEDHTASAEDVSQGQHLHGLEAPGGQRPVRDSRH
jgi:hypothetical protein